MAYSSLWDLSQELQPAGWGPEQSTQLCFTCCMRLLLPGICSALLGYELNEIWSLPQRVCRLAGKCGKYLAGTKVAQVFWFQVIENSTQTDLGQNIREKAQISSHNLKIQRNLSGMGGSSYSQDKHQEPGLSASQFSSWYSSMASGSYGGRESYGNLSHACTPETVTVVIGS